MCCLRRTLRLPAKASPLASHRQSSMMSCNFVPIGTILRLSTRSNLSVVAEITSQPSQETCDNHKNTIIRKYQIKNKLENTKSN